MRRRSKLKINGHSQLGKIPYEISIAFGDEDQKAISNAMAYMEEKTCIRFIKWTSDMPSKTKMTFMANFGGMAKYGDCTTNWSRKNGRIVYFL